MRSWFASLRKGALALGLSFATAVPLAASPATAMPRAPVAQPTLPAVSGDLVQDVQYRGYRRGYDRGYRRGYNRGWRGDRRYYRHRRNNGAAAAAIGLGLGLGALALANRDRYYYDEPRYVAPRRVYRGGGISNAHVDWCYNRYRSYRAYDNSFQPYNGPRRICYSPYG